MNMKLLTVLGLLLLATASRAGAADDPIQTCMGELRKAIEALGEPRAGEVASERSELIVILASLQRRARDVAGEREAIEADQRRLDFHRRDRDDKLRQIDREVFAAERDHADLKKRRAIHEADLRAYTIECVGAPVPESEVSKCRDWAQRIKTRAAQGNAELEAIQERFAELDRRRETIAKDAREDSRRTCELQKRRSRLDRGAAEIFGEAVVAQSRALALRQIINSPSRTIEYQSPSAVADKVVTGLFQGMAKQGALTALEGQTMVKVLAKVGLKAAPVGVAFTVADTFADVANAGVDQRVNEVTRNLFLVGDYAAVMKTMVNQKGSDATKDPAYIAMRRELERLRSDMPSSDLDVVLQGLNSAAALGEAFASLAGGYAAKRVAHTGATVIRHLNKDERKMLGKGGVNFARQAINALTETGAEETTKNGSKEIIEALRGANQTGGQP
ncbi:MAG: hypothetical protein ABFD92_07400 [Planctomycetaceae bacterium]|nr:hypothetical protein [Planctomycetaceae bacterium]